MTQRYEKEIEEILKNAGESQTEEPPSGPAAPPPERRPGPSRPPRRTRPRSLTLNYKYLLGAGLILLLVSMFVGGLPLFLLGAALLVAGYVVYYKAPRSGGGTSSGAGGKRTPKMWRGRTIDPGDC